MPDVPTPADTPGPAAPDPAPVRSDVVRPDVERPDEVRPDEVRSARPVPAGRAVGAEVPSARSGTEGPHRSRARIARVPVLAVIVALLVVGLVVGRADTHGVPALAAPPSGPTAAPVSALSSSWFCAGATEGPQSDAPGELVITNAGPGPVTARITVVGTDGGTRTGRRSESVTIGSDDRRSIPETVPGRLAWTGAIVDLDGGAVTVEQQITGPLGTSATPCATAGSNAWYFATGATLVNASSEITLLDPYPTPAIANLSFTTNEGQEAPEQFSGIVVPAGQMVAVDLGSHLRRRSAIATSVTTSYGRVVAWKTDIVSRPRSGTPILGTKAARAPDADPASGVLGVTVTLGAPAPSTLWRWPEGSTADGVDEQYVIYNPGTRTADLTLAVDLDEATATAEPLDLTVGPQETTTITTGQEARIPAGSGYSVTLRSANGIPVVAERTVALAAPAPGRGVGEMLGSTLASTSWVVGAGSVSRHTDELLAISNPAIPGSVRHAVTVTLQLLADGRLGPVQSSDGPGGVGTLTIRAGGRVPIDLGSTAGAIDGAIVVHASGPVVVERDLEGRRGTSGISISLAVPLVP